MFLATALLLISLGTLGMAYRHAHPSDSSHQPPALERNPSQAIDCEKDLDCMANRGLLAATQLCPPYLDGQALARIRWTDAPLEPKFSQYRWTNETHRGVTYLGDRMLLQAAPNEFIRMTYECEMDTDSTTVLGVRMHEGHL